MTLLLIGGLIFVMVSVLNFAYVIALQSTTLSTQYMLYRYIVTGQYANAPVDYMRLMIPSMITGAIGLVLFISFVIENRKKETQKSEDHAAIYEETIGGLEDNELFAIIDTNAPLPVLLVTSQVFDDGTGKQTAIQCDVYYLADREVKKIKTIESMGTAYPISYDETGIYTASGHAMQRYEVDQFGTMKLAEVIQEQFDENGTAAYTMETENKTKTISEEEYYAAFETYNNAAVVSFAYGASDAAR